MRPASHRSPSIALLIVLVASVGVAPGLEARPPAVWEELEPGLEFGVFEAPQRSEVGDSMVRALRIDPARFELRLMSASTPGQARILTARRWCERNDLVAAINASMYQADYRSSVSLMRTRDHVNNPRVSGDNTILAFDRLDNTVPEAQIIDRTCQDLQALRPHYGSLVQSIRMISCDGRNVWKQQDKKWSTAAIGVDGEGRVLFLHVRSQYSTHDLINILLALPLDLKRAMYVEGGPEAQLYVHSGDREEEHVGILTAGLVESGRIKLALPVPNVVGIARKGRAAER